MGLLHRRKASQSRAENQQTEPNTMSSVIASLPAELLLLELSYGL